MSNYSEYFRVRGETLYALMTAYTGYARALEAKMHEGLNEYERKDRSRLIGSCYLIAATYKAIIEPAASLPMFSTAANYYKTTGNAYWKLLAICGKDRRFLSAEDEFKADEDPQEFFYELLRQYYLFINDAPNTFIELTESVARYESFIVQPVGRNAVLLETYINALNALKELQRDRGSNTLDIFIDSWLVVYQKNIEQLRFLQADKFHWNSTIGFFPFEPEIFAFALCVYQQVRRINRPDLSEFWNSVIQTNALPVLNIVMEIANDNPNERHILFN